MTTCWPVCEKKSKWIINGLVILPVLVVGCILLTRQSHRTRPADGAQASAVSKSNVGGASSLAPPTAGEATTPTTPLLPNPTSNFTSSNISQLSSGGGRVWDESTLNGASRPADPSHEPALGTTTPPYQWLSHTCSATDGDELHAVMSDAACSVISLNGDMFNIRNEILVDRPVLLVGRAINSPTIDGSKSAAVRIFRVVAGGFLQLQFIIVSSAKGFTRQRIGPLAAAPNSTVQVTQGGSVFFEGASTGGHFLGVTFNQSLADADSVESAIKSTLTLSGKHTYGGSVLVAGGTVKFVSCTFFSVNALTPFTDVIIVGGDILVLGGSIFLTDCVNIDINIFNQQFILGLDLSIMAGTVTITWTTFYNQALASLNRGLATGVFVGGGVCVLVGVNFISFAGIQTQQGSAAFYVASGALIMTGVNVVNGFGLLWATGVGFNVGVGAGILVQTGVNYFQTNGLAALALLGQAVSVGTGVSQGFGVTNTQMSGEIQFWGDGAFHFCGAGVSTWIGSPSSSFAGISSFMGLGGSWALSAGLMVNLANPSYSATGINLFLGLGTTGFVGGGAAVIGYNPQYSTSGLSYSRDNSTYWVTGDDDSIEDIAFRPHTSCSADTHVDTYTTLDLEGDEGHPLHDLSFVAPEIMAAGRALSQSFGRAASTKRAQTQPLLLHADDAATAHGTGHCERLKHSDPLISSEHDVTNPKDVEFKAQHMFISTLRIWGSQSGRRTKAASGIPDVSDGGGTGSHAGGAPTQGWLVVRQVLQGFVNPHADPHGSHVAVSPSIAGLSTFKGLLPPTGDVGAEEGPFTYNAVILTSNASAAEELVSQLDAWSADAQPLVASLSEALGPQGWVLTDVEFTYNDRLSVPKYNSPDYAHAFAEQAVNGRALLNVMVTRRLQKNTPTRVIGPGEQCYVALSGFPPLSHLSVSFVGHDGGTVKMISSDLQTSVAGAAELLWKVPRKLHEGSDVYVKVVGAHGHLTATSGRLVVMKKTKKGREVHR